MKKDELLSYIRQFSEADIKEFGKFLKSPYFIIDKSLYYIFAEIIKHIDLVYDDNYEKLIKKISRKLKYSEQTVIKQLTYLSKALIKFLKIKSFESDTINSEITFNNYLLTSEFSSILSDNIQKTDSLINRSSEITENIYLRLFQHNVIKFTSIINCSEYFNKNNQLSYDLLSNASKDLILFVLQQATGIYINYFFLKISSNENDKKNFPIDLNLIYSECIKNKLFENEKKKEEFFNLYYDLFMTFYRKDDNNMFLKYMKSVEDNVKILSKELIKYHYQVLINFCMLKERLGEESEYYKKTSIQLLYKYFSCNYFKVNDTEYINSTEFTNYIGRAYSVGDYEIIKAFVDNNASKLRPSEFSEMVRYGYAYYYLGKKDYRKALKNIVDITPNNKIIKYNVKNIELRIYYELNKFELLHDALHNYNNEINNVKILTKSDKIGLQKLVRYLSNLVRIKCYEKNNDKKIIEAKYIRNNIEKEPVVALKSWLLKKYTEVIEANQRITRKAQ